MRQMKRIMLLGVLCGVTTVQSIASGPAEDVKARYAVLSAAVAAKDLAKVASLYSADATFQIRTPKGQDRVTGLESIVEMWQGAIREGAVSFDATVSEASSKSDVITEKGTFAMKKKDGSPFLKGTYSGTWRREKTEFKITSHQLSGQ